MSTIAIRDFLRLQMRKAGLTETEEMKKILETEDFNLEIPEFISNPIAEKTFGFMQAVNKPEIRNNILADRFSTIEASLKNTLKESFGISSDDYENLRGDKESRNFQTFLSELLPELKNKVSNVGGNGQDESKKSNQKDVIQKLENQIVELTKLHSQEIDNLKNGHSQEINNLKISTVLNQKLSSYNLKESLNSLKNTVYRDVIDRISQRAVLKFDDESGTLVPYQKNDSDLRLMSEKNEVLTIENLLDAEMSDFIAKSTDKTENKAVNKKVPKPKTKGNPYVFGHRVVNDND